MHKTSNPWTTCVHIIWSPHTEIYQYALQYWSITWLCQCQWLSLIYFFSVCVYVCVCACMPECVCVWAACVVCLCASFIIKKSLVWSVGPNDCDLLKLHLHCEPSQLSKNRRTQNFKLKGFPVSPRMLRALHTTASDVHILGHLIWVRLQQLREQSYPFLPACAAFSCAWTLV